MTEAGGPTNQAGVTYQNSITALYIGRMLDSTQRFPRDRVLKVRSEGPYNVDDIQVWMADGSIKYIQAKKSIRASGKPWSKVWKDFRDQINSSSGKSDFEINLTLGEHSQLAHNLRECTEKAKSSVTLDEFQNRLTKPQKKLVENVEGIISFASLEGMRLFSRLVVEIFPNASLERDYVPLWIPKSSAPERNSLYSILRDYCASRSSQREMFLPEKIRLFLKNNHEIQLIDPDDWGSDTYRKLISDFAKVNIPGTNFSKIIDETFPWPICFPKAAENEIDFDDEAADEFDGNLTNSIDIRQFPNENFNRVILVGGAGLGKSLVTNVLAARIAKGGQLPVLVKIPNYSKYDYPIDKYLDEIVNSNFSVKIDWQMAAEKGRLILILDGLDEVEPKKRQLVLERLKVFSLRFPNVPWMLTVRDATALNIAIEGQLIEIKPLDEQGVTRLIQFYTDADESKIWDLVQSLRLKPSLYRLMRIPLFLALFCVTSKDILELPSSRSEVIEDYLSIILTPENHKPSEGCEIDSVSLRMVAEMVAFSALQRDEIGIDISLLQKSISDLNLVQNVDLFTSDLVKCGMLKRVGVRKLYFPFPTIQEYLAGCYLSKKEDEHILLSLKEVSRKPWAQAIQFALEKHHSAEAIANIILDEDDDAFATRLRLVARCITNGMPCSPELRTRIAEGLDDFWPIAGWILGDRVGQLIAEAFFHPLLPSLQDKLYDRYYLHRGLGKIVTNINSADLTFAVLKALVILENRHLYNLGDLQKAVNRIPERAFDLYISLAINSTNDVKEEKDLKDIEDLLTCLLDHLDTTEISKDKLLETSKNEKLFAGIRLVCFSKTDNAISEDIMKIAQSAILTDQFQPRNAAFNLLARKELLSTTVCDCLANKNLPNERLNTFLDSIRSQESPDLFLKIANINNLPPNFKLRCLVLAARHGHRESMIALLNEIDTNPFEIVSATLSIFGHYQSYELASKAALQLSSRDWTSEQKLSLASSVRTGMTTIFQMDGFQSGLLDQSPLHPGAFAFETVLEEWSSCKEFNLVELLSYDLCLAEIGYQTASSRIRRKLKNVVHSDEMENDEFHVSHTIGSAIRFLKTTGDYPDLETIECLIRKGSHNSIAPSFDLLASLGSRDALDMLLWAYNGGAKEADYAAFAAIEKLAGRLGVMITRIDDKLVSA